MATMKAKNVELEVTPEELSWLRRGLNSLLVFEGLDHADEVQVRALHADLSTE
jgi:hypothetical protein